MTKLEGAAEGCKVGRERVKYFREIVRDVAGSMYWEMQRLVQRGKEGRIASNHSLDGITPDDRNRSAKSYYINCTHDCGPTSGI